MPPRIPISTCLRAQSLPSTPQALPLRTFSGTTAVQAQSNAKKRRPHDAYAAAYRKSANQARQEVLKKERALALGDPIQGVPTPFVESFDKGSSEGMKPIDQDNLPPYMRSEESVKLYNKFQDQGKPLNHFVKKKELVAVLQKASQQGDLTEKTLEPGSGFDFETPVTAIQKAVYHKVVSEVREKVKEEDHQRANTAMERILQLNMGSSKDRYRVNVQRCINTFGRHNTDLTLKPHPSKADQTAVPLAEKRAGPDTGSSEVQVAILTAKIRTLSQMMAKGNQDKHNKRNLRVLVHKRQKHLKYLHQKERGGPRWQHLIDTLGLTEGTWKGEISL